LPSNPSETTTIYSEFGFVLSSSHFWFASSERPCLAPFSSRVHEDGRSRAMLAVLGPRPRIRRRSRATRCPIFRESSDEALSNPVSRKLVCLVVPHGRPRRRRGRGNPTIPHPLRLEREG
jgi:hypothetical protein